MHALGQSFDNPCFVSITCLFGGDCKRGEMRRGRLWITINGPLWGFEQQVQRSGCCLWTYSLPLLSLQVYKQNLPLVKPTARTPSSSAQHIKWNTVCTVKPTCNPYQNVRNKYIYKYIYILKSTFLIIPPGSCEFYFRGFNLI